MGPVTQERTVYAVLQQYRSVFNPSPGRSELRRCCWGGADLDPPLGEIKTSSKLELRCLELEGLYLNSRAN